MIVDKIRADQARMSFQGWTARLLGQEMVIKREKCLVHHCRSLLDYGTLILCNNFLFYLCFTVK